MARTWRVWATGLLVALLCAACWLSARKVQLVPATEAENWAPPLLYEGDAEHPAVAWVGCFSDADPALLTEGPQEYGFNTKSCAKECDKFTYMALRDAGKCTCGDRFAKNPESQRLDNSRCGVACKGEDDFHPTRYCGSKKHNAVYRLSTDWHMVGTWLFGNNRAECEISRADDNMHLRFSVPLPKGGQMANGILHKVGKWLSADLTSQDGEPVGTIRLRRTKPSTIVSNFKYPGEHEWNKDTFAQKATEATTPTSTTAAIREWRVVTSHGLNVRSNPDTTSKDNVLGTRQKDTIIRGRLQGNWVKLTDEPGFMLTTNGHKPFLEEVGINTWEVVTSHGLNVRGSKDDSADILGIKPSGTVVEGTQDGNWVVLVHEPGFMMISNRENVFLAKVATTKTKSGAAAALVTTTTPITTTSQVTTTIATTTTTKAATTTTMPSKGMATKLPSIFCYALMMPSGYEPGLLKAQFDQKVGIFTCDDYTIFSNKVITIGYDEETKEVLESISIGGSLKVAYGGKWNTALNTGVFIRVWKAVIRSGKFLKYDWTVKVDPDAVFFPERLRDVLKIAPMSAIHRLSQAASDCHDCKLPGQHGNNTCAAHIQWLQSHGSTCMDALQAIQRPPPTDCGCVCGASSCVEGNTLSAMYLVNCRFGLHGPIEVVSANAVIAYIEGLPKCKALRAHPWGEDKFMDRCMQLLGIRRVLEYNLLSETACGQHPAPCETPNVAFHPFKEEHSYFDCWRHANQNGTWH